MDKQEEKQGQFWGTYFDSSTVIKIAKVAEIAAWVVVVVYALDFILAAGVFALSNLRGYYYGIGFTDYATNIVYIVERPFRGVVYFVVLQAIAHVLLIFLDVEANLRKTARNTSPKS